MASHDEAKKKKKVIQQQDSLFRIKKIRYQNTKESEKKNQEGEEESSTKAAKEMKGRVDKEEQTASSSSRELQHTTMGSHGRRPSTPSNSTTVSCASIFRISISESQIVLFNN